MWNISDLWEICILIIPSYNLEPLLMTITNKFIFIENLKQTSHFQKSDCLYSLYNFSLLNIVDWVDTDELLEMDVSSRLALKILMETKKNPFRRRFVRRRWYLVTVDDFVIAAVPTQLVWLFEYLPFKILRRSD